MAALAQAQATVHAEKLRLAEVARGQWLPGGLNVAHQQGRSLQDAAG